MNITLDERLMTCAEFVRENAVLADIGTDHAYLPAYLIKNGKIVSALACDINEKPLESARATVTDSGVCDKVELRLCDGLKYVSEDEFSDVVIAGMGGEMIIKILSDCPYIKNEKFNLILQPMSKTYDLRKWLCQNGFKIKAEKSAGANNKIYTVINSCFTGEVSPKDEKFYYFGKLLLKSDEKSKKYIQKVKNSLIKRAKGILSADSENKEAKALIEICKEVQGE